MALPSGDGLLAWWQLDETSGTRYDSHTGGHHAVEQGGSIGTQTGPFGGLCPDFTGDSGAKKFWCGTGVGNFTLTDPFSMAGWVYTNVKSNDFIICRYDGASRGWQTRIAANATQIRGGIVDGATNYRLRQSGTCTFGQWYHFVTIYDGAGTVTLYRDGVYQSSYLTSGTLTQLDPGERQLEIGGRAAAEPNGYLDGGISRLSLWNVALTSDEVTSLYNSGAEINYRDIVPLYTFPILRSGGPLRVNRPLFYNRLNTSKK